MLISFLNSKLFLHLVVINATPLSAGVNARRKATAPPPTDNRHYERLRAADNLRENGSDLGFGSHDDAVAQTPTRTLEGGVLRGALKRSLTSYLHWLRANLSLISTLIAARRLHVIGHLLFIMIIH